MSYRRTPLLFLVIGLLFPGAASAESNVWGLTGFSRVSLPETKSDMAFFLGGDYTKQPEVVYADDKAAQMRLGGGISVAPLPWLELGAAYRALETTNHLVRPHRIQSYGDSHYALKAAWEGGPWKAGAAGIVKKYVGASRPGADLLALGSYQTGDWVIASNAGWSFERHVVIEASQTPIETFAWQKPALNAFVFSLGAGYEAAWGTPFLEYETRLYAGHNGSVPHRLTAGSTVKTTLEGLGIRPEVAISTAQFGNSQVPAEPLWRGGLWVTYAVPVRALRDKLFPPPGSFTVFVTDARTGEPLDGATFMFDGRRYQSDRYGAVEAEHKAFDEVVRVERDGYVGKPQHIVVSPSERSIYRITLERNTGVVKGRVFLAQKPGTAQIRLDNNQTGSTDGDGRFTFELPPARYTLAVSAEGFQPLTRSFEIKLGGVVVFDALHLSPKPLPPKIAEGTPAAPPAAELAAPPIVSPPAVALPAGDEETAHETERQDWLRAPSPLPANFDSPVFFAFGESAIDPRAYPALDRLTAALLADPRIERVVIEGRADSIGPENINMRIAAERADAVYRYLRQSGVDGSRMATTKTVYHRKAVGQSDPQRAQDRRVGFRIEYR